MDLYDELFGTTSRWDVEEPDEEPEEWYDDTDDLERILDGYDDEADAEAITEGEFWPED